MKHIAKINLNAIKYRRCFAVTLQIRNFEKFFPVLNRRGESKKLFPGLEHPYPVSRAETDRIK